jgi:hypothetical protein
MRSAHSTAAVIAAPITESDASQLSAKGIVRVNLDGNTVRGDPRCATYRVLVPATAGGGPDVLIASECLIAPRMCEGA